jgi:hypothetical protein
MQMQFEDLSIEMKAGGFDKEEEVCVRLADHT